MASLKVGSICRLNLPEYEGKFSLCRVHAIKLIYSSLEGDFCTVMVSVQFLISDEIKIVEPDWIVPTGSKFSHDKEFYDLHYQSKVAA